MKNYKFTINGNKYSVDILKIDDNIATVEVNGKTYTVEIDPSTANLVSVAPKKVVKLEATPAPKAAPTPAVAVSPATTAPSGGSFIKSPLPGVIIDVFVQPGDAVKAGQRILMLEAMKMENNIDADKEGTVIEVSVQKGDSVMEGDVLVVIG